MLRRIADLQTTESLSFKADSIRELNDSDIETLNNWESALNAAAKVDGIGVL